MIVLYYYHIPKCGGTYIHLNIQKIMKHFDFMHRNRQDFTPALQCSGSLQKSFFAHPSSSHPTHLQHESCNVNNEEREDLQHFYKTIPDLKKDFVYIHHHHRYPGLKEVLPDLKKCIDRVKQNGDQFYMFTCLRSAIPTITSHVNYVNQACPNQPAISFTEMIDEEVNHNFQSKYLLYNCEFYKQGKWSTTKEDIQEILNIMDKVYSVENIKEIERDFKTYFFGKSIPWDRNKVLATNKIFTPTRKEKEELFKKNKLDLWLYNYATQVL
jgi:hypothetical protein